VRYRVFDKSKEKSVIHNAGNARAGGCDVHVDGQRRLLEIDPRSMVGTFVEPGSRLERNVRFQSLQIERLAGEADFRIQGECSGSGGRWSWFDFGAGPDAPGQKERRAAKKDQDAAIRSPMTGKVLQVAVKKGDVVTAGQLVCIIEAMKMENKIVAPTDGVIQKLSATAGALVSSGDMLATVGPKAAKK